MAADQLGVQNIAPLLVGPHTVLQEGDPHTPPLEGVLHTAPQEEGPHIGPWEGVLRTAPQGEAVPEYHTSS